MQLGRRIGIIGNGAWGTALAILFNRAGLDVTLWGRNQSHMDAMREQRINTHYLPDIFIEPSIKITHKLSDISDCDMLLLSIPAQAVRTMGITLSDMIDSTTPLIIGAKGIERGSALLMTEVLHLTLPNNPLIVISGPNFAYEAARGLPTACVLASTDIDLATRLQFMISGQRFRPYLSDDVIGVQIGGAAKNIIALACGIMHGAGMGENARAAVMTRGLAEMTRLAQSKGAKAETLYGLSGFGDLVLSCSSRQSRNMRLGIAIGERGGVPKTMLETIATGLTEGVMTADAVYDLALKLGVPMPICVSVADLLNRRITLEEATQALLSRPVREEI